MATISEITLRNFKSFRNAHIPFDEGFTCLVGPNGSGKCVDGSSEVILSNGSIVKIEDLVENHINEDEETLRLDDGFASTKNPKNLNVLSLNPYTLKIEERPIRAFIKRSAPAELFEIIVKSGRKVITTGYHPVLSLKDGKLCSLKAENLDIGSYVAIPRMLNIPSKEYSPLLELSKHNLLIYAEDPKNLVRDRLRKRKKVLKMEWKDVAEEAGIPYIFLKGFLDGQATKLKYAFKIAKFAGFTEFEILHIFNKVKGRSGKFVSIPINFDERFARFLGYVISEGSIKNNTICFYNISPEIREDFSKIVKEIFDCESVKNYDIHNKEIYLTVHSSVIVQMLEALFEQKRDGVSSQKKIPSTLLQCDEKIIANFLSALYDGDGSISKASSRKICLEYVSASKSLIKSLVYLFLRFGIVARIFPSYKCATNTKLKRTRKYYRCSIYGLEAIRKLSPHLKFKEKKKRERMECLSSLERDSYTSIDLIPEINPLIKSVLKKQGYTDRKLKGVKPSRIRAYYENRCLPSRKGVGAVVKLLENNLGDSEELVQLQNLAESEVFWDQIKSIRKINGKEFVYDLTVAENHNFLVEGIFVHNSAICDAMRFVLGETSLRALRARKVQELIHGDGEKAVIKLKIAGLNSGDGGAEIIRAIRNDGKTVYRLNGRRATRTVVMDFLKSKGLEIGYHNVIAQGEVDKIIRMNSKERRRIIDEIAGVAEFEEKKRESLSELGKVEQKLNDARIVMKEREGILEELEKEKDAAVKYLSLKDEQRRVKGTLIITQYKKIENEFTGLVNKCIELTKKRDGLTKEMNAMNEKITEIESKRREISEKIASKDTHEIYGEVEELRGKIAVEEGVKKEKDGNTDRIKNELTTLKGEEKEIDTKLSSFTGAKKAAASRAAELKERLKTLESEKEKAMKVWEEKRKNLKTLDDQIDEKRDRISQLKQELTKISTKIEMSGGDEEGGRRQDIDKEMARINKEIKKRKEENDSLFAREKEMNRQIQSLDSSILRLKEEIAVNRGLGRSPVSNAINTVLKMKNQGIGGIYGTVADLYSTDKKYEIAAEAAAGGRLNYVVVENAAVATEIIKRLKKENAGRATFIPLNVSAKGSGKAKGGEGIVGKMIDLVKFDKKFSNIFEYVFGETVLVDDIDVFKKLSGIRMVTTEGDIAESSGVITGGKIKRAVKVKNTLQLERELDELKSSREQTISDLYKISDMISKGRRKIAEYEIKRKELEIELGGFSDVEIGDMKKVIAEKEADVQEGERELLDLQGEKERIRIAIENSEDEKERETFDNEILNIKTELSSIETKLKGEEGILLQERLGVIKKRTDSLKKEEKGIKNEIDEIDKRIKQLNKALNVKEEKIKDESSELERLYAKSKKLQEEADAISVEKGKNERILERTREELIRSEATKGSSETRLADLKAEVDAYKDIQPMDATKKELEKRSIEIENELQTIGFANLKAPEMYEERLKDYNEIKSRVSVLEEEKNAVMKMIEEIETRKKDVFMKTFNSVSKHFKELANKISPNETYLALDNEQDPFEGGLNIILKIGKKERSIEAMSGGEKSLLTIVFVFALHMYRPSQFYILDEVEAALDKENSKKFADLIKEISKNTQFIVVSHNDTVIPSADTALGITKTKHGSKVVGIKLTSTAA